MISRPLEERVSPSSTGGPAGGARWRADDARLGPPIPRRVALFTETFLPRVDGIVNTLCWTLRGLVEAGCEPLVVAPAGNTADFLDVRVLGATSTRFPLYPEVRLAVIGPGTCRELDRFEPELIHLVGPVVNGAGGLVYAQTRQLPVIASFHTDLPRYAHHYSLGWLEGGIWRALRAIHNRCGLTLCPSHAVLHDLRRRGFERLRYWSRGVDTSLFSSARSSPEWRARVGAHDENPLLLYVGRLAREKRVAELAPILRAIPAARLAIVGDGPARQELEHALADLPATFLGYLSGLDLATAYASADLFVFPSAAESFGNVVLEAMASGLPVVAAAAGGVLDLVEPGATGLLFRPGDESDLVRQVQRYLADRELRRRHGAAGRAAALARTWERQQRLLLGHYAAAVAGRGPLTA